MGLSYLRPGHRGGVIQLQTGLGVILSPFSQVRPVHWTPSSFPSFLPHWLSLVSGFEQVEAQRGCSCFTDSSGLPGLTRPLMDTSLDVVPHHWGALPCLFLTWAEKAPLWVTASSSCSPQELTMALASLCWYRSTSPGVPVVPTPTPPPHSPHHSCEPRSQPFAPTNSEHEPLSNTAASLWAGQMARILLCPFCFFRRSQVKLHHLPTLQA